MVITETKRARAYLSGPMSNYKNLNFESFEEQEKIWTEAGFEVISPAAMDIESGDVEVTRWKNGNIKSVVSNPDFNYEAALQRDLAAVATCQAIVLLPGWNESPGAKRELAAALALGLEVIVAGIE